MNKIPARTKIETASAIIGAGIGAVGALMVQPIVIGVGAVIATLATMARISDRRKALQPKTATTPSRIAAYP